MHFVLSLAANRFKIELKPVSNTIVFIYPELNTLHDYIPLFPVRLFIYCELWFDIRFINIYGIRIIKVCANLDLASRSERNLADVKNIMHTDLRPFFNFKIIY